MQMVKALCAGFIFELCSKQNIDTYFLLIAPSYKDGEPLFVPPKQDIRQCDKVLKNKACLGDRWSLTLPSFW